MQVLVLGMHRSGTSVLTELLSSMGCYAGPLASLQPGDAANPRGYWEHRGAWALDEEILAAAGASWWEVADLDLDALAETARASFVDRAGGIVAELDAHRPWVLKDPRFCVLLPVWRLALSAPVFVLAHRHPLEVARSLQARDGFPLAVGLALWEVYTLAALRSSLGAPRVAVDYATLLQDPAAVAAALAAGLEPIAPGALRVPAAERLADIVDSRLHRQRSRPPEIDEHLTVRQAELLAAVEQGTALAWQQVATPSAGALDTLRRFAHGEHARAELHSRAVTSEGEVAWRRERDAEISQWNENLRAALTAAEVELGRLREHAAATEVELGRVHEHAAATAASHEALAGRLATGEGELTRLRQRDFEISQWNESLTARLAAQQAEIDRLGREAEIHRREHQDLVRSLLGLRGELDRRAGEAEGLQGRLAALQELLREAMGHSQEWFTQAVELDRLLAETLRSRSWRLGAMLTAPARWGRHTVMVDARQERVRANAEDLVEQARSMAARIARQQGDGDKHGKT